MINKELHLVIGNLSRLGIIMCFNGSFTQGIIEEIGEAIKDVITKERENYDETRVYDVFAVYIELAQNIRNYFVKRKSEQTSVEICKHEHDSIIVIGEEDEKYYVCSGNVVKDDEVEVIKKMIDNVNSMTKVELKKFYRECIRMDKKDATSAGLGIIDMARKSTQPLEYFFEKRSNGFSFFTLKIVV